MDLHTYRLQDDEDVTEDDRGTNEAKVSPYRPERDLARKLGRPADLEKLMFSPDSTELCRCLRVGVWSTSQKRVMK